MKIQIGKFSGELIEGEGMPDILECVTDLLIADGWHPQTIYDCMKEELERMVNMYKIDTNEDSGD